MNDNDIIKLMKVCSTASGSTLRAAMELGRDSYGFEVSRKISRLRYRRKHER